ncbi:hypothetical protein ACFHWW_18640 [Ensifer sp. P24N7]|uniref:hypothetical protein n=1 Tax=Sinorhizobium sp. P24N7 TaxID=3348358 RepID=UPI0035F39880
MPVVQNGENLWRRCSSATLFNPFTCRLDVLTIRLVWFSICKSFMAALNNAVIPDKISLTLPPKPALPPSAAALEHKRQDRLTPLGRLADLAIDALSLAGFSHRSFPANRHGAAPQRRWLATIDSGGGGLRPP